MLYKCKLSYPWYSAYVPFFNSHFMGAEKKSLRGAYLLVLTRILDLAAVAAMEPDCFQMTFQALSILAA